MRIEPPVYTDWGTWGQYSKCAPGHYVVGVQLRIEPDQGPDLSAMFDDTLTSLKQSEKAAATVSTIAHMFAKALVRMTLPLTPSA